MALADHDASATASCTTSNLAGVAIRPYPRGVPKRLVCLAVLSLAGRAVAAPAPPLTIPELAGPRTLALQSGIGLASGTEALFKNPAALAARKRYVADTFFLTDRRPDQPKPMRRQDYLGGSVLDSNTTAVAAGLAYVRAITGVETGTMLRLGLATAATDKLFLGVQGNYYDLRGPDRIASALNVDAGGFYQVSKLVSIGATAYNVLSTKHRQVLPRGYGVGFAAGSDTSLQVIGDWRADQDQLVVDGSGNVRKKTLNRYSVGAEYFYGGAVPVRAGFELDDATKQNWWSAGAGYVTAKLALDVSFRQSASHPSARTYGIALRIFVPNE